MNHSPWIFQSTNAPSHDSLLHCPHPFHTPTGTRVRGVRTTDAKLSYVYISRGSSYFILKWYYVQCESFALILILQNVVLKYYLSWLLTFFGTSLNFATEVIASLITLVPILLPWNCVLPPQLRIAQAQPDSCQPIITGFSLCIWHTFRSATEKEQSTNGDIFRQRHFILIMILQEIFQVPFNK